MSWSRRRLLKHEGVSARLFPASIRPTLRWRLLPADYVEVARVVGLITYDAIRDLTNVPDD